MLVREPKAFLFAGLLSLLGHGAPALGQSQLQDPGAPDFGVGEERVLGVQINPTGITFRVRSAGCTQKENFGLETLSRQPLTVRLIRLRPDYCTAKRSTSTLITFTFAEISSQPVIAPADRSRIVVLNDR